MIYTSGVWSVKEGREEEFARAWQQSVDGMSLDYPGIVFRLLHDIENESRFISVAGPWRNIEQVTAMRNSQRFSDSMSAIQEVLVGMEIATYEVVAEVS